MGKNSLEIILPCEIGGRVEFEREPLCIVRCWGQGAGIHKEFLRSANDENALEGVGRRREKEENGHGELQRMTVGLDDVVVDDGESLRSRGSFQSPCTFGFTLVRSSETLWLSFV